MSMEDNCTLSNGCLWTRAICNIHIDFTFLAFSHLAFLNFLHYLLAVKSSVNTADINTEGSINVFSVLGLAKFTVRSWPPTLFSRSPRSHSSCSVFASAFVVQQLACKINAINTIPPYPVPLSFCLFIHYFPFLCSLLESGASAQN